MKSSEDGIHSSDPPLPPRLLDALSVVEHEGDDLKTDGRPALGRSEAAWYGFVQVKDDQNTSHEIGITIQAVEPPIGPSANLEWAFHSCNFTVSTDSLIDRKRSKDGSPCFRQQDILAAVISCYCPLATQPPYLRIGTRLCLVMAQLQDTTSMDWTDCPLVEVVPGKVSGVPLLKGTRLPADTVLSNYESGSPVEEISDNFDMPEQTIRDLLSYAANKQKQLQP